MWVYELVHITDYLDEKQIGFFASREDAEEMIASLITQVGFCDYPHNFFVIPHEVQNPVSGQPFIYEASAYYHDEYFFFEESVHLGIFGRKDAALASLRSYFKNNRNKSKLQVEAGVYQWKFGEVAFSEGFTSEGIMLEGCDGNESI